MSLLQTLMVVGVKAKRTWAPGPEPICPDLAVVMEISATLHSKVDESQHGLIEKYSMCYVAQYS